ncbi:MAG: leucyl aminopeptidase [Candidatus Melainabacteria bacterium]|nr:leucyl aminopeptidase [Candidatus Melainabacteria bacterium]
MKVILKNQKLENIKCDVLIVNLFEGVKTPGGGTGAVDLALKGLIKKIIKEEDFKGKIGSTLVIRTNGQIPAKKVIVVGLGKKEKFNLGGVRKVAAASLRTAKKESGKTVCTILHGAGGEKIERINPKDTAQAITEVAHLALYEFTKYKSKDKNESKHEINTLIIAEIDKTKLKNVEIGIKRGNIVAKAQKLARDLVSEPALSATPTKLANVAKQVARENKLKIKVLDRDNCKKLKMGAFLAVAQGSKEPPKFIEIKYIPKKKPKKHIAIIGKGITFDSGGLSLKPANSMETMKDDMSGAAAAIATMSTIRELKPDVAVTMIVAATENMPSGSAYKPGDVIRAMNGKTIEILNTDAEGRVTLADAISYAAKQKPDEIVDLATLTGACVVALGDTASGVMTNNQKLVEKIIKAGNEAGERMWQLPIYDEDREKIKSDIADMINTGSKGKSGAQNGAVFIEKFVNDIPWVHIDIAGPSWIDKENDYGPKGPTGVGVRTLINYLTNYA